jgi:hypothetical protein
MSEGKISKIRNSFRENIEHEGVGMKSLREEEI